MPKQMKLSGFTQFCVNHQSQGQWKNPAHGVSQRYCDVQYWIELARTLERGYFDSLFFADVHGTYSIYKGSARTAIEHGLQFPGNDPTLLVSAMAAATQHLGFGCTFSTTYFPPYHTAKLFSTLDHLTGGRIAWNVVTSYLPDALANFGISDNLEHDARYDRADEYMDVVYKLWEHSWEDGAFIRDAVHNRYIDPDKVHPINHAGKWFSVPGPHMCEPSPQRTPVIYQAGTSGRGVAFAGKHAEAVFIVSPTVEAAAGSVKKLREAAVAAGRGRDDIKMIQGIAVVVAPTDELARLKAQHLASLTSPEASLALFSGWSNIDLSTLPPGKSFDDLDESEWQGIRGLRGFLRSLDPDRDWSREAIADYMALGSIFPKLVGSPQTVATEMERWIDDADVDGFNIHAVAQPSGLTDFVDLVVPELQRRGRVRTAYDGTTQRENYFGAGHRHLPANHPAFKCRPDRKLAPQA